MVDRNAPQALPRAPDLYDQRNEQETRDIIDRMARDAIRRISSVTDGQTYFIDPRDYGASLTSADNSVALADAFAAAVEIGVPCIIPTGTFRGVAIMPEGLILKGQRRRASRILRPVDSVSNYVLFDNGNKHITVEDLVVDGDKDNNANPCNGLVMTGGGHIVQRVRGTNCKFDAGYGTGIVVSGNTDFADGTRSLYVDCSGIANDFGGVIFSDARCIDIIRPYGKNGSWGVRIDSIVSPVVDPTITDIYIEGAGGENASQACVSIAATFVGSGGSESIDDTAVSRVVVNGAWGRNGDLYGVVVQGEYVVATNLHGTDNGHTGVLWNVRRSTVATVVATGNDAFGIDAGFATDSSMVGVNVVSNANVGVNSGGGKNFSISGGYIGRNGINVLAEIYEATFTTAWPVTGSDLLMSDLTIDCSDGGIGLLVSGISGRASDVSFIGSEANCFRILSDEFFLVDCRRSGEFSGRTSFTSAGSTTVISETMDTIIVGGSGESISMLLTQNQVDWEGLVAWIEINDYGTGYTSGTLDFSAGSGTGAAATVLPTAEGGLGAPRITNYGSGYSADFAVTASGDGSGWSGTAHVGTRARSAGRRIALYFQGANTLAHGTGNINAVGGVDYVVSAGEVVSLVNIAGVWVQEAPSGLGASLIGIQDSAGIYAASTVEAALAELGQAWTSYTPTLAANTGTITTSSAAGAHRRIGKTVLWRANFTITTNGTGAGFLTLTLPVAAVATNRLIGVGANSSDGVPIFFRLAIDASTLAITLLDGSYPGLDGKTYHLNGSYEAA